MAMNSISGVMMPLPGVVKLGDRLARFGPQRLTLQDREWSRSARGWPVGFRNRLPHRRARESIRRAARGRPVSTVPLKSRIAPGPGTVVDPDRSVDWARCAVVGLGRAELISRNGTRSPGCSLPGT